MSPCVTAVFCVTCHHVSLVFCVTDVHTIETLKTLCEEGTKAEGESVVSSKLEAVFFGSSPSQVIYSLSVSTTYSISLLFHPLCSLLSFPCFTPYQFMVLAFPFICRPFHAIFMNFFVPLFSSDLFHCFHPIPFLFLPFLVRAFLRNNLHALFMQPSPPPRLTCILKLASSCGLTFIQKRNN